MLQASSQSFLHDPLPLPDLCLALRVSCHSVVHPTTHREGHQLSGKTTYHREIVKIVIITQNSLIEGLIKLLLKWTPLISIISFLATCKS